MARTRTPKHTYTFNVFVHRSDCKNMESCLPICSSNRSEQVPNSVGPSKCDRSRARSERGGAQTYCKTCTVAIVGHMSVGRVHSNTSDWFNFEFAKGTIPAPKRELTWNSVAEVRSITKTNTLSVAPASGMAAVCAVVAFTMLSTDASRGSPCPCRATTHYTSTHIPAHMHPDGDARACTQT